MTQLATTKRDFWDIVEAKCTKVVPNHLDPTRFWQMVVSARSSKSLRALNETPAGEQSLARAFWGCATLGLYPDPVLQHIAIVPFRGEATLIPMYQGFVELAYRTGFIKNISAHPVFAHDEFDWDVANGAIKHRPHWLVNRGSEPGELLAAYAVIDTINGGKHVEVMSAEEINKIRDNVAAVRKGGSTPWTDSRESYIRMAVKTPLRRAFKYLPKLSSPQLAMAATWDEETERGVKQSIPPLDEDLPPVTVEASESPSPPSDDSADFADEIGGLMEHLEPEKRHGTA